MRLADLRTDYRDGSLDLADLDPDPLHQFAAWLAAAATAGLPEPNAMCLATVDADGAPSSRMVLLKGLEASRLLFFTGLASRKARALTHEPRCALTFWWDALERQVRVEGRAERVSDVEADAYFATRPRGSQLAAWASPQSQALADRAALTSAYSVAGPAAGWVRDEPHDPPSGWPSQVRTVNVSRAAGHAAVTPRGRCRPALRYSASSKKWPKASSKLGRRSG